MDVVDLALIGWLYSVGSGIALLFGVWLIIGIHLRDPEARKQLAARVIEDSVLFGIWILGLSGGIGVLVGKSWSRWVLELFCWALMVLVLTSAYGRWRAAPPPRAMLAASMGMFILPLILFCAATIFTLRGETALRTLSG